LQFDFDTIQVATEDFSNSNKLGEGGFGAVYRVNNSDEFRLTSFFNQNMLYHTKILTGQRYISRVGSPMDR